MLEAGDRLPGESNGCGRVLRIVLELSSWCVCVIGEGDIYKKKERHMESYDDAGDSGGDEE